MFKFLFRTRHLYQERTKELVYYKIIEANFWRLDSTEGFFGGRILLVEQHQRLVN